MMRLLALSALISGVIGSQHIFSIDDDILAFPQYEVVFSDTFISEIDADYQISAAASRSSGRPQPTDKTSPESIESIQHAAELAQRTGYHGGVDSGSPGQSDDQEPLQTYESMYLDGRRYLCAIPIVEAPPRNESAEAVARAAEEKELAHATNRGWELLRGMEGECLYYISDWWSYRFCYNGKVTQFHRLPPQKGVPFFPPLEDPTTASYVLGQVKQPAKAETDNADDQTQGELSKVKPRTDGGPGPDSAELQTKGDTRYLVHRFGHGTTCDLTGKDRRIEVQYHCQPQAPDRIGWIKEVSTCTYVMVVYTSRLCDDVAFLPPRENKAHPIACREVVKPADVEDWKARIKLDALGRRLLHGNDKTTETDDGNSRQDETSPPPRATIGGVPVGARQHVGSGPSRQIKGGAAVGGDGKVTVVAKKNGGRLERLNNEQLRRLHLDPESVDAWGKELDEQSEGKGWTLEIVKGVGGEDKIRGVVASDEEEDDGGEETAGDRGDGELGGRDGSEEGYHEEL